MDGRPGETAGAARAGADVAVNQITGSLLALSSQTPGTEVDRRALGARRWRSDLAALRRAGFSHVDLLDGWLPIPDLAPGEIDDLGSVLSELGLRANDLSLARCSLIDPERGAANLDYVVRAVDAAAALGLPMLTFGFHPPLGERHRGVLFWEVASDADDRSAQTWALAAERVRRVCAHAAARGIGVSIELYEDSLVCTAADVVRLMAAVGAPNLGVNPDLGNTYRSATPQRETWLATLRGSLPFLTYWHLKNYARYSASPSGPFAVVPTALGDGGIDYRVAVREVLDSGYRGPLVVEHYGGDALHQQEVGRRYLERLLADLAVADS